MSDVSRLEQQLEKNTKQPPVDRWSPPVSGDIDIRIDREGHWYHEGTRIVREPLVRLFASILWYENGDYYLVTPVEKWRIQVEEAPLVVTQMRVEGEAEKQRIHLQTRTEDAFVLSRAHPLLVEHDARGEPCPKVRVRYTLDALVHRNVFYQLAELAQEHPAMGWGVWSDGEFWTLA